MQSTAGDAQCFIAADESWFSLAIDVLARGPLCLAPTWPPARVHTRRVRRSARRQHAARVTIARKKAGRRAKRARSLLSHRRSPPP
jgi:hypothetical protein